MFPTKFCNDAKSYKGHHLAVTFRSEKSQKEVIDLIKKMGVSDFITPDQPQSAIMKGESPYIDRRISGMVTILNNQQCCAFTKTTDMFYLFPIHTTDLENVGLVDEDLIEWVKYLNGMKAGFKYIYLGKTKGSSECWKVYNRSSYKGDETFHWIMVPRFNSVRNKPYLHWIALRYLINTHLAVGVIHKNNPLAYYNIPRIAMMLNNKYGLTKFRAFLFAHLASPFYYFYSMFRVDSIIGVSFTKKNQQDSLPDVGLTTSQFRSIWATETYDGGLNYMLSNYNSAAVENIRQLVAEYDINVCFDLFAKGDYQGFIDHIKGSYIKVKKTKKVSSKNVKEVANS